MTSKRSRCIRLNLSFAVLFSVFITMNLQAKQAEYQSGEHATGGNEHAHHSMETQQMYKRTVQDYQIPDVTLINMNGDAVSLISELNQNTPHMLNFIFTSCTAVCPVMSATFAHAQKALASEPVKTRFVSISIDPEYDTPTRLRTYARKFNADDNWHFITGELSTIIDVQRAFDAYRGDKMNHAVMTLMRTGADDPWVRLEGFTQGADLVREFRTLLQSD